MSQQPCPGKKLCENFDSSYCICCFRNPKADYRVNDYYEETDEAMEIVDESGCV